MELCQPALLATFCSVPEGSGLNIPPLTDEWAAYSAADMTWEGRRNVPSALRTCWGLGLTAMAFAGWFHVKAAPVAGRSMLIGTFGTNDADQTYSKESRCLAESLLSLRRRFCPACMTTEYTSISFDERHEAATWCHLAGDRRDGRAEQQHWRAARTCNSRCGCCALLHPACINYHAVSFSGIAWYCLPARRRDPPTPALWCTTNSMPLYKHGGGFLWLLCP